jgi:hypothetical protein
MQAIYLDGYKGLRYNVKSADDDFGIFDLSQDPQEAHNLAADPKFASLQAAMKARVLRVRRADPSAPRPYDEAFVPPVAQPPSSEPGITWSLFHADWPWMPDFRTLMPTKTGTSEQIELTMAPADKPFGVVFNGYFVASHNGEYRFTVDTDTGAMLFLHDIRVIDEPRKNSAGKFSGSVRLEAGWHALRLLYRHATGQPRLEFTCERAGGKSLKLDATNLRQSGPRMIQ